MAGNELKWKLISNILEDWFWRIVLHTRSKDYLLILLRRPCWKFRKNQKKSSVVESIFCVATAIRQQQRPRTFSKMNSTVNVVQESLLSFPKNYFNASDKECSHPIEISEGISWKNWLTGFCMTGALVANGLKHNLRVAYTKTKPNYDNEFILPILWRQEVALFRYFSNLAFPNWMKTWFSQGRIQKFSYKVFFLGPASTSDG